MMPALVTAELVPMATHGAAAVRLAMVQPGEIAIVAIIFGSMSALFYPLIRALARRMEGGASSAAPSLQGVEDRLDRIERSVEAIALEVERVSEGQRFVTKLLAEKAPSPLPPARP